MPAVSRPRAIEQKLIRQEVRRTLATERAAFLAALRAELTHPRVPIVVLPGGKLPMRMTEGAVGYDSYLRALVHPTLKDAAHPALRRTVFDFARRPRSREIASKVRRLRGTDELAYWLEPGESVLGGIGFALAMPFPLSEIILMRSGLAARHQIAIQNAPGLGDPDYRGEMGALIENESRRSFPLRHEMRIVQVLFLWAVIPAWEEKTSLEDLPPSKRGVDGFGHSGIFGDPSNFRAFLRNRKS